MSIVKYKNQSGVTYAYEQTSVYDADKKQSRPIRKYLGRVDPETGEIISTKGKRGRPPKQQSGDMESGSSTTEQDPGSAYEQKCREVRELQKALSMLTDENSRLKAQNSELCRILSGIQSQASSALGRNSF